MSIKVRMYVDMQKLEAMVDKSPSVADGCTKDAADWIKEYILAHWSGKVPSDPGKPPAVRTHTLEKSIRVRRQGEGMRFVGRGSGVHLYSITAGAVYAAALEYGKVNAPNTILPRPFMRPAVEAAKQRFAKFFYPIIDPRTLVYNSNRKGYVNAYEYLEADNGYPVDLDWDGGM